MHYNPTDFAALELKLQENGYKRVNGSIRGESYAWWKTWEVTKDKWGERVIGYQTCFKVYDFTKYNLENEEDSYGVESWFYLGSDAFAFDNVNVLISRKGMTLVQFEWWCTLFYNQMIKDIFNSRK